MAHLAEIKTEIGHAVGINIGRRWRNFDAELHYGYVNTEFKKASFSISLFISTSMPAVSLNYLTVVRDWAMDCHLVKVGGFVLLLELVLQIEKIFLI